MRIRAEFLVEPFEEGTLGSHVRAAIDAARQTGLDVDVGPFGNVVSGETEEVSLAVAAAIRAAIDRGATRIGIDIHRDTA